MPNSPVRTPDQEAGPCGQSPSAALSQPAIFTRSDPSPLYSPVNTTICLRAVGVVCADRYHWREIETKLLLTSLLPSDLRYSLFHLL